MSPQTKIKQIKKRDGSVVDFNPEKITLAITKAMAATREVNNKSLDEIVLSIISSLEKKFINDTPSVEDVQDAVEEALMKSELIKTAKAYILYRQERISLRDKQEHLAKEISKNDFFVTKRSGEKELFDLSKIASAIDEACAGLPGSENKKQTILDQVNLTIYDGISTEELDETIISATVGNIKDDPDYDTIATNLLLKSIYKKIFGSFANKSELVTKHKRGFVDYINKGIREKLLNPVLAEKFDLEKLSEILDIERDNLLTYIGLRTIMKRYMLRDRNHDIMEAPQYFRMRVAMGLAYRENDPMKWVEIFYNKLSKLELVTGGSVSIGAGTTTPSLSNCYLMDMHDSIDHIGKTTADVMKLLKATGGIGLSVTKLRAEGSPIESNNTASSGPIPFINVIDSTLRAVSRAGKKKGALCFYMENWHLDFNDFLDLKQNAGDDYRRARTANTAVYISDEFMYRVKNKEEWYLFDPKDVPDLTELYGEAFSKRYKEYIEMAKAGKIKKYKVIGAEEQLRNILVMLQTTSHPWLTWKDTINLRALNNNTGTIHCSNLCTEITLPQDEKNVAVCNLTYINLAKHLEADGKSVDWAKVAESSRTALRLLDDLIDVNEPPIPEAKNADTNNRAVGLGLMGFAEVIENLGWAYDNEDTYNFADKVFEFVSFHAISESAELAQARGSYKNFQGSMWSQGYVPVDSLKNLDDKRKYPVTVNKESHNKDLDWDKLRSQVKEGIRNATVMAIAPNANGGIAAGTSPGLDPRFSQMFSRSTLSGKYLEVNKNLIKVLKERGLWEQVKDKILASQGEIRDIPEIPDDIKAVYKTSFTTSPYAFIEVAARAQKWIDQAISRNMYLETRDIDEMMRIYTTAWEKGVKTTYYLHMKPRHSAEQSTVKINKSIGVGKVGFGSLRKSTPIPTPTVNSTTVESSLTDPQEKLVCDSCA